MDSYADFQETVWDYYRHHGRDLPWRHLPATGYEVLVSEIMLQQTQVSRVIPKYQAFLHDFPDIETLATASLADVLRMWSGLGYGRRAKYLHDAAKQLRLLPEPWQLGDLVACKGIGHNTAAAVVTYAYNQPTAFIETNVRTVYIHHFFPDVVDVTDAQLLPVIEATLDREHPREWYWALMDYGSFLKTSVGNLSRQSKHHTKQSRFEGSKRQVRGMVLRALAPGPQNLVELQEAIADDRLTAVLEDLAHEGLIISYDSHFRLAE